MARRPRFPSHESLTHLSRDDAERALSALRVLCKHELLEVYTSAGSHDRDWQVWSNVRQVRIPLAEWATQWLATWYSNPPTDGGDAA